MNGTQDLYNIKSIEDYHNAYRISIEQPEKFWGEIAEKNFLWRKKWSKVLNWDQEQSKVEWYVDATCNITENCIDRHLVSRGNQTAIIWEPNDPTEKTLHITYKELSAQVNKMANVLRSQGVRKGDRVCIYLPMIPELAYSVLACARIGAVHSVVFAGFSSHALSSRIEDANCKVLITSDGSYRGSKIIDLKGIVDEALKQTDKIEKVLVVMRTGNAVEMVPGRDIWLKPEIDKASNLCEAEEMNAEDMLFILYTSGSTGKPKGMVHTIGGYMVYTAYTFKTVFQYEEGDVYWCTADIGWITGHSYIIYGPLTSGATTVMFEGIPSYPHYGRFWEIVEKHQVNQFYTAPTAIRALAKQPLEWVKKYDLSSLKTLGSVGEPINEEAWSWYNEHIGNQQAPIVDTYWQTENGGFLITPISGVTPIKPTYATLPFLGIQACLMDGEGNEIKTTSGEGRLCVKYPWPSIARTIYGNHDRYVETYFSAFPGKYFTGDGAMREENGYYRITGRVDDVVIVSGHNLGTAPIEDAINEHPWIAESAIVGFPHEIKGNALYGYINLKKEDAPLDEKVILEEINLLITNKVKPIAKLDKIQIVNGLPKTRSGKIMRRILRKIAAKQTENLGDISTLLNPECVQEIIDKRNDN